MWPRMPLLTLGWRAFSLVTLVALNTYQISHRNYGMALLTGGLVSWVWWGNTRKANRDDSRMGQVVYTLGAAAGTVTGMWIGEWIG
jgi:hypothetical protein